VSAGDIHMIFGKLGLGLILGFALDTSVETVEATHFACSGTLATASESQDLPVREEPWSFSLAIDSDKNAVTIDDTSIPIISDASEPIVAFKEDPADDPSLGSFWGGFNTLIGTINIYVKPGAIFTGTCKPAP
jgi:hypothetical protein